MLENFSSDNVVASSTATENIFKEIKSLLDITKKKRVDTFTSKHLEHLSGHLKIGIANQRSRECAKNVSKNVLPPSCTRSVSTDDRTLSGHTKKQPGDKRALMSMRSESPDNCLQRKFKRSLSCEELSPMNRSPIEEKEENWRNKNKKQDTPIVIRSEKRRGHKSILSQHDVEYFHGGLRLLKNGYDTVKLTTENTCSFDSIYPVFAVACLDYHSAVEKYLKYNETLMSEFLKEVVSKEKKKPVGAYRKRNAILDEVFSSTYYEKSGNVTLDQQGNKFIDCHTGLATFFSQLTHKIDRSLASYTLTRTCDTCESTKRTVCPLIPLNTSPNTPISLVNIEENINLTERHIHCTTCKSPLTISRDINTIIAFEVEPPVVTDEPPLTYTIQDIQSQLKIEGQTFKLFAIIDFVPRINHFVSYVRRRNNIWEKYDDINLAHTKEDILQQKMNVFMLFYVNID